VPPVEVRFVQSFDPEQSVLAESKRQTELPTAWDQKLWEPTGWEMTDWELTHWEETK
jgi:hypothetical protein